MIAKTESIMPSIPYEMLILAGGFGTRLQSVVNDVPKPMAPVSGRPFLEYLLNYWIDQGVRRFVLSVGYKGEYIKEYFGTCHKDAEISYVHESKPLGTGGAVRMAFQETVWKGDYILLANGDTWFECDLRVLNQAAYQHGKPVTMALKAVEHNDRYGGVTIDDGGLIYAFGAIDKNNCLINAGCYLLEAKALSEFLRTCPEQCSFEEDLLKPLADVNQIASSLQNSIFLDIGIPTDFEKATAIVGCYKK
jgi:D-glycero-alpha-D-manno-heptose 1-phosphate guanylyltransferase